MARWVTFAGLVLILCGGITHPAAQQKATEEQAVRGAAARFYSALNVLFTGDVAPMLDVWSHADDVSYMGPAGGFQKGWPEVRASWESQAAMKLGGKVEPAEMRVVAGDRVAVTHNWERGQNVGPDGKVQVVSIRATNVFRKEGGVWKMIGHQTDLLPYLAK
jgi:ketosteroid isomerase-like protein